MIRILHRKLSCVSISAEFPQRYDLLLMEMQELFVTIFWNHESSTVIELWYS